ncbi:MAG TPA: carbohydrate ABC transporter permease [Candidatus Acidoferrum sp.]|nr:carbohydrate ABC transporter permease [Candidatus Methylomirabilis sp.]HWU37290.1 carbohydrate ABC transporter permease [Candidatus Acidoferrum sp.]
MKGRGQIRRSGWRLFTWPVLGLGLVWTLFPFYWMITTALKPNDDMYRPEPLLVPVRITLSHFHKVFFDSHFPEFFRNSAVVAIGTTILSLAVGIFAAYAIVRLDFRGKKLLARGLIFSYLVPPVLLFIPLFELIFKLNLLNTKGGLILAYLTFTVPFTTWLLMGYFRTVPVALEEAALVDGCTRLTALFRVTLPLSAPAIVVTALFSFTLSWNEFLYALTFTSNPASQTVTVGLTSTVAEDVFFWGVMMGASFLVAIPPVVLYLLGQRWVVRGLTAGAVKG